MVIFVLAEYQYIFNALLNYETYTKKYLAL